MAMLSKAHGGGVPREHSTEMIVKRENNDLCFSGISELSALKSGELKKSIQKEIGADDKKIVFDLSTTEFLDSGGLGLLISFHKSMSSKSGKCVILNPSPIVTQILELTRLHKVFEILHETREKQSKAGVKTESPSLELL